MRGRNRGAGLAALAAVAGVLALATPLPAFADGDAPPSTTAPTTTTAPSPTDPTTPPPSTTVPTPTTTTEPAPTTTTEPRPSGDAPTVQVSPVLTVTPSTDLVNLQSVTVAGTGWSPGVGIGWAECKNNGSGTADDCDLNHIGFATTDGSGAFSTTFVVHRILHTANGDVDCATAPETCSIGAGKVSDPNSEHAGSPISFDPSVPLPPPPTLLAGPLDHLVEGDSVAMFGGGFVPNAPVVIVECSQPTVQTCQTIGNVGTDGGGNFITLVQVHRVLATPPFGATDCAAAPGTCQLRAVSLTDYDFEAHVLLDFDPSGPLPPGDVTVTPDTDLLNFQKVTVAGTQFPALAGVQIVECKTGATSYEDCSSGPAGFAPTDGTGAFSVQVSVRRILHLEGGDFDCGSAPKACSLVSSAFGGTSPIVVSTPISFDSSVPPPPPPTISVTPNTGLLQGQSVTVTGANFAPNSFVEISECEAESAAQYGFCPLLIDASVSTDDSGAFSTAFTVRRGIIDFGGFPPSIVDCGSAPQLCSIVAVDFEGGDQASQAIDFDPSAPIPVPDVTVTPQFDLPDRGVVHVHSSGFAPGERVVVSQCPADSSNYPLACVSGFDVPNILVADADGVVDTSLRVHRDLTTPDGVVIILGETSCADSVGACVIRVQSLEDPLVQKDVPLGFDPTAVAPPPVISTTPSDPFTDGQEITVHGSGFTPNAVLGLAQCQSGVDDPGGPTCDSQENGLFTEFTADADGTFTRTITVHTQVQGTDGPIDCSVDGSCVLFAANRRDYGVERTSIPIGFAPGIVVEGASQTRALAFTGAGSSTVPAAVAGIGVLLGGGGLRLPPPPRAC
jgi:hypothetical protein